MELSEQQHRQNVQMRWNYHPQFGSPLEWNGGHEFEVQQLPLSPRGVSRYQPSPPNVQSKSLTRSPMTPELTPTNEYQVR